MKFLFILLFYVGMNGEEVFKTNDFEPKTHISPVDRVLNKEDGITCLTDTLGKSHSSYGSGSNWSTKKEKRAASPFWAVNKTNELVSYAEKIYPNHSVRIDYPRLASGTNLDIGLYLSEACFVELSLSDQIDADKTHIFKGILKEGEHTFQIDIRSFPEKKYYIRLQTESHNILREISIVK